MSVKISAMTRSGRRRFSTAAAAVLATGALVAAPVVPANPIAVAVNAIQLLATGDVTIDFIRHGESTDNVAGILGTRVPGALLTDTGRDQAVTVGHALFGGEQVPGAGLINITDADQVYASGFLRAQQTAWPLLDLLGGNSPTAAGIPSDLTTLPGAFEPGHILFGLNELDAGILQGLPLGTPGGILYMLPAMAWTLGLYAVPQWGSMIDPNGMAFQNNFGGAVDTIYANSPDGGTTAAFSHAAAIMAWTQMNVDNPNPLLIPLSPLDNTGQVVIEGSPDAGWTMLSWNGSAVAPANLYQDLFVNTRELIVAPQMAGWNLWTALLSLDPDQILGALQDGLQDILRTTLGYPGAMLGDILDVFGGNLDTALTDLNPLTLIPVDLGGLLGGLFAAI